MVSNVVVSCVMVVWSAFKVVMGMVVVTWFEGGLKVVRWLWLLSW